MSRIYKYAGRIMYVQVYTSFICVPTHTPPIYSTFTKSFKKILTITSSSICTNILQAFISVSKRTKYLKWITNHKISKLALRMAYKASKRYSDNSRTLQNLQYYLSTFGLFAVAGITTNLPADTLCEQF